MTLKNDLQTQVWVERMLGDTRHNSLSDGFAAALEQLYLQGNHDTPEKDWRITVQLAAIIDPEIIVPLAIQEGLDAEQVTALGALCSG